MQRNFYRRPFGKGRVCLTALSVLCALAACGSGNGKTGGDRAETPADAPRPEKSPVTAFEMSPRRPVQGDTVTVTFSWKGEAPDSAVLYVNGKRHGTDGGSRAWKVPTDGRTPVGDLDLKLTVRQGDRRWEKSLRGFVVPLPPRVYRAEVRKVFPHSRQAYTQGLEFYKGHLYEGTGEYGRSVVRRLSFPQMEALGSVSLPRTCFGEGITVLDGKLYQLTWRENRAFVYDPRTWEKLGEFHLPTEGWGLTNDGKRLYQSDGTETIYVRDPATFEVLGRVRAFTDRGAVRYLNELEWIEGEIWANVYGQDVIVRINPETGAVTGVIDASGLLAESDREPDTDVLNGIARDPATGKIYLTGKNWPKLFEVSVRPAGRP